MTEQEIQNSILREFGTRPDMRIWRNNTGGGAPGYVVDQAIALLMQGKVHAAIAMLKSRRVNFGVPGQADLSGLLNTGQRLEIEVKTQSGRQREDQINFQAMIERFGGLYILARNNDDIKSKIG